MENEIKDGGPAFPVFIVAGHADPEQVAEACRDAAGLTVRDYFAAKAMQGYLSNSWLAKEIDSMGERSDQQAIFADIAYSMADAMLAARKAQ